MTASEDRRQPTIEFTPHPLGPPLPHCPACGSAQLEPVVERELEEVHFLCRDCSRCWHVELGRVTRVVPPTCYGCPQHDRCAPVYEADHSAT
jgi:hypothetical protein